MLLLLLVLDAADAARSADVNALTLVKMNGYPECLLTFPPSCILSAIHTSIHFLSIQFRPAIHLTTLASIHPSIHPSNC